MKQEYRQKNVFGNDYTVELLSREEIEKILEGLDLYVVAGEVIDNYVKGWLLDVDLNPETGELMYGVRTQGSGDIATHYIPITLVKNLRLDVDDIYGSYQYDFFGYSPDLDWHERQKIAEAHEDWRDACIESIVPWLDQQFQELEDQRRDVLDRIYSTPV